jgi:hypothetical protein
MLRCHCCWQQRGKPSLGRRPRCVAWHGMAHEGEPALQGAGGARKPMILNTMLIATQTIKQTLHRGDVGQLPPNPAPRFIGLAGGPKRSAAFLHFTDPPHTHPSITPSPSSPTQRQWRRCAAAREGHLAQRGRRSIPYLPALFALTAHRSLQLASACASSTDPNSTAAAALFWSRAAAGPHHRGPGNAGPDLHPGCSSW